MTVLVDETYCNGIAELLDVIREPVIPFRVKDRTVSYCNAAWAAGHDLEPGEVIGHTLDEFLDVAEWDRLETQLIRLSDDNPVVVDDIGRSTRGLWLQWVDRHLPDAAAVEVFLVSRTVNGHKPAELNLADGEAPFLSLADKSADVVWNFALLPEPHFDYMSPSVQVILGYPPAYFLDDFSRFLHRPHSSVGPCREGVAM